MLNISEADQKAMGIFSGLFIAGGVVLRGMAIGFYWMAIAIGVVLGAVAWLSKFREKRKKRRRRKR